MAFFQSLRSFFILILSAVVLTACGGGGSNTPPPDTTPDSFSFTAETGAALSAAVESPVVTVSGLTAAATVTVTGGEYQINSGGYTSASGTVSNGQTIQVRVTASSEVSTDATVTLMVGGVAGTFTVTTLADTTAPTAEIIFPTTVSATDGTTLTVRGSAEDDYSDIQAITLTVSNDTAGAADIVTATSLSGSTFASWSGQVDLEADILNVITITTEDAEGNIDTSAASVQVTHQSVAASFPDANSPFSDLSSGGISFDTNNNRLVVSDIDEVFAVNLSTGVRSVLIASGSIPDPIKRVHVDSSTGNVYISSFSFGNSGIVHILNGDGSGLTTIDKSPNSFTRPEGIRVSPFDGLLYVADVQIHSVNPETGASEVEADFDDNYSLFEPKGLDFVTSDDIIVTEIDEQSLYLIDITVEDGVFTELLGPSDLPAPEDVEYDADDARAIVVDSELDAVVSVPVAGGSMTTISNATTPNTNTNNVLIDPAGIVVDDEDDIAFVTSTGSTEDFYQLDDVIVVDLETGERVVLTRSAYLVD